MDFHANHGDPMSNRFQSLSTAAMLRGAVLLAIMLSAAPPLHGQTIAWVRQFAYSGDAAYGVATGPAGIVYVGGLTFGNLDGQHGVGWDNGFGDAFLTRSDSTGYNYGSRQLDTSFQDMTRGVAADKLGNVFIVGTTEGPLFDFFKGGILDGFFVKLSGDTGATLASPQLGTPNYDEATAVAADGLGNGYATGFTSGVLGASNLGGQDVFVYKSPAAGSTWTRQFGSGTDDQAHGIAADELGNVFVTGSTAGDLGGNNAGGRDVFLTKMNPTGDLVWSRQTGTLTDDEALAAAVDHLGNVFIAGFTTGDLAGTSAGGQDVFLSKYDAAGTEVWTRQFGTTADEQASGVAIDGLGNVFIAGYTTGNLNGTNFGGRDAFVSKFSGTGELRWTRPFATLENDEALGIAADDQRNIYVSGQTSGGMHALSPDFNGNGGSAFFLKMVDPDLPGDFNFDRTVDAADYIEWRNGLNTHYPPTAYGIWKANFGAGTGPQQWFARGSFNGFGLDHPLVDQGDGHFTSTVSGLTPGQSYDYKVSTEDWSQSEPTNVGITFADAEGTITLHLYDDADPNDGWSPNSRRVGYDDPGQFGWELMGEFNGWGSGPQWYLENMGGGLHRIEVNLNAGDYQFKFRQRDSWDVNIGSDFGNHAPNAAVSLAESGRWAFELDLPGGRWRAHFVGANATRTAVPEPNAFLLMILGLAAPVAIRRGRPAERGGEPPE